MNMSLAAAACHARPPAATVSDSTGTPAHTRVPRTLTTPGVQTPGVTTAVGDTCPFRPGSSACFLLLQKE